MCGCVFVGVIYAKVQFTMSQPRDEMSTLKYMQYFSRNSCDVGRDSGAKLLTGDVFFYSCDKLAVACDTDVTEGHF